MRIILDTNVLVSGIFWSGPPYQILQAWRDRKFKLVVSPAILDEYTKVAIDLSFKFPSVDLLSFLDLLMAEAEVYMPVTLPKQVCRDPNDDKILACALASRVGCIVSGDRDLLVISGYKNIQVFKPKDFVTKYL